MDAPRGERSVRHGRMWPHTDGGAAAARRHALRARAISRTDVQKGGPRAAAHRRRRGGGQSWTLGRRAHQSVGHRGPLPGDGQRGL